MKEENIINIKKEILKQIDKIKPEKNYSLYGIKFNPFPPAAIPRYPLEPLDPAIEKSVVHFIRSTYFSAQESEYAGLTIKGEYGSGKTHLMKYIQHILNTLSKDEKSMFSAITCFIDRPESSPQKIVHRIIEEIGLDNIRKYVWNILIDNFKSMSDFESIFYSQNLLFFDKKNDGEKLFSEPRKSNYLEFLKFFKNSGWDIKKLQEKARDIIKEKIVPDTTLADRFLDLIFEEKKATTSWDVLAGYVSTRGIQNKEVTFLNSVVKILQRQGFKQLYVFIDEFEDISKMSGAKLTDYSNVLNTLINKEKKWALIISLNDDALKTIKEESTPLHDRLTSFRIDLKPLNLNSAQKLVKNYLNLVREKAKDSIRPFSEDVIKMILDVSEGNQRSFILLCHKSLEIALKQNKKTIDQEVINEAKDLRYDDTDNNKV